MTAPVDESTERQPSQQSRPPVAGGVGAAAALYLNARQPQTPDAQVAQAVTGAANMIQGSKQATSRMISGLWRFVDPYDDAQVADFAQQAGRLMVTNQRAVANTAAAAQLLQLKAVGINENVAVSIPDNVRGVDATFHSSGVVVHAAPKTIVDYDTGAQTVTRSEATPDKLFERAAVTYRYQRSIGDDHLTANDVAVQRIDDLVDGNTILAQRLAEQQTLTKVKNLDDRLIGYRRVIHPELSKGGVCGLCVAASDRVYYTDQLRPIHLRCKCTVSPVTDTQDPGHRLNQGDLSMLYEHGAETAPTETFRGEQRQALPTSAKALKRTRYDIVHHHELGPVLVRVEGDRVPYFTLTPPELVSV